MNAADRAGEVVRLSPGGAEIRTFGRFPRAILSKMAVPLPDGRDVVKAWVSGRMRLMAMAEGKRPEPLLKTQEESSAPMTPVAGNRIAFVIGPEPRETIAVADTATGRILGRITPGQGVIPSVAASVDAETLYFTASGAVRRQWSRRTRGSSNWLSSTSSRGASPVHPRAGPAMSSRPHGRAMDKSSRSSRA